MTEHIVVRSVAVERMAFITDLPRRNASMNDHIPAKLRALLSEHGQALCADPQRCRDRLSQVLPGKPREVNLLAAAVSQQVVADMLDARDEKTVLLLMDPLAQRLADDLAMTEPAARWAVQTWALALGIVPASALGRRRGSRPTARGLRSPRTWLRILLAVALGGALIGASALWVRPTGVSLPRPVIPRVLEPARYNVGKVRAFTRPELSVRCLAAAPDGRTAATGGDGGVRLWDLGGGREIRHLPTAADEPVVSVAFSPDGQHVLGGIGRAGRSRRGPVGHCARLKRCAIYLWNRARGDRIGRLAGHTGGVSCVTFTPDGRTAWSAGTDGLLCLWDVKSRSLVRELSGHTESVRGLAVSKDGRLGLSAGADRTVRLWDLPAGKQMCVVAMPAAPAPAVAFADSQPRVLTAEQTGSRSRIHLWAVRKPRQGGARGYVREKLCEFRTPGGLAGKAAFSPDGAVVTFCREDGRVHLWQIDPPREIARFHNPPGPPAVLPGQRWRLLLAGGGFLHLWHLPEQCVRVCVESRSEWISDLAFSGDGRRLIGWDARGTVETWAVPSLRRPIPGDSADKPFRTPQVSPQRRRLFGDEDGALRLWDMKSGKEVVRFEGHRGTVTCWTFSADCKRALSGGADGTVRLWDLKELRALGRFEGHAGGVTTVAFSPDGRLAASAGQDGTVRLWGLPGKDAEPGTKANQ